MLASGCSESTCSNSSTAFSSSPASAEALPNPYRATAADESISRARSKYCRASSALLSSIMADRTRYSLGAMMRTLRTFGRSRSSSCPTRPW